MSQIRQMTKDEWERSVRVITIAIILILIIVGIMMSTFGINTAQITDISNYVESYVIKNDGTTLEGNGVSFPTVRKGEKAIVTVSNLPTQDDTLMALCFHEWTMSVRVYYHNEEIYSTGTTNSLADTLIGHRYVVVYIPEDYDGSEITIELTNTQSTGQSYIDLWECPLECAYKSMLSGHEISYMGLISIIFISFISIIIILSMGIITKRINPLLYLMFFQGFTACWNFGSCGFYYITTDSVAFSSLTEYAAIFLAPIPLTIYMRTKLKGKYVKRFISFCTAWFIVLGFITFVTASSPVSPDCGYLLMILHVSIMFKLLFYVISLIFEVFHSKRHDMQIADWGFITCMIIAFLEFFRRDFVNYISADIAFLRDSISVYAVAILTVSTTATIASVYAMEFTKQMQRAQLENMAFNDQLTGILNRAGCSRELERLANEHVKNYTMIFMDLNYLKKANDEHGHETGDALLKDAASVISKTFAKTGFCGRWGGDEFIACIPGAPKKADKKLAELIESIKEYNENHDSPVELSIAAGRIYSSAEAPLSPEDAVKKADEQMYLKKQQMKSSMD